MGGLSGTGHTRGPPVEGPSELDVGKMSEGGAKPHPLLASGTMYVVVTDSFHSLYLLPCSFPFVESFLAEGCIDGLPLHGCHLASANENPRKRDGGEDTVGPRPCILISVSWWWSRSPLYPDLSSSVLTMASSLE